jgi:tetraacyldisaccharide 4'-kinase
VTEGERVVAAWYAPRPTLRMWLAWPLSLAFRAIVAARRALYRTGVLRIERMSVPVVVVGNITVGGTGKTPLVIALCEALRDRGFHPGAVSRGYGGSAQGPRAVAADDDPALVGDEPLLIAEAGLPVFIGADRPAAARALLRAHPQCDVIVCDDGLQHYRLARDVEIAVVDDMRGLGNGLMLPAGPLREPASRLREVDAVVRLVAAPTRSDDPRTTYMTQVPGTWRNLRKPERVADVSAWRGTRVHAVAGIGNPGRFFALLRGQGIGAVEHAFPDHHAYTRADFPWPKAIAILMTQKDAVKCASFADERFWYLPVRASIDPALVAVVERKIRGPQAA